MKAVPMAVHGYDIGSKLHTLGLIPAECTRILVDIPPDGVVTVYYGTHASGDLLQVVLDQLAVAGRGKVVYHRSSNAFEEAGLQVYIDTGERGELIKIQPLSLVSNPPGQPWVDLESLEVDYATALGTELGNFVSMDYADKTMHGGGIVTSIQPKGKWYLMKCRPLTVEEREQWGN